MTTHISILHPHLNVCREGTMFRDMHVCIHSYLVPWPASFSKGVIQGLFSIPYGWHHPARKIVESTLCVEQKAIILHDTHARARITYYVHTHTCAPAEGLLPVLHSDDHKHVRVSVEVCVCVCSSPGRPEPTLTRSTTHAIT